MIKKLFSVIKSNFSEPVFLIGCCAFFSFSATANGILNFLGDGGAGDHFVYKVFVIFYVGMMTWVMVWALQMWMSPTKFILRMACFFCWVVLFTISVSFSYAFFWETMASKITAYNESSVALKTANDDLQGLDNTLRYGIDKFSKLERHFSDLSWKERGVKVTEDGEPEKDLSGVPKKTPGYGGDTCGTTTEQKVGPRTTMRIELASEMKGYGTEMFEKSGELGKVIKSITQVQSKIENSGDASAWASVKVENDIQNFEKDLTLARQKYSDIRNITVRVLTLRLNKLADMFLKDDDVFFYKNQYFSCHDVTTADKLTTISGVLDRLPPPLPPVDLKNYVGTTATRSALAAFERAFFGDFIIDRLPLLMALLAHVALIILSWWKITNGISVDRDQSSRKYRVKTRD